jgi:hypothetical protein
LKRRKGERQNTPLFDYWFSFISLPDNVFSPYLPKTYQYGQGEHEAIHYGLWMTYPTYSAGKGACDKQLQGLNYTFDRFVQRKVHLFC